MTSRSGATAFGLDPVAGIGRERAATHGDAQDVHQTMASLASAYVGAKVSAASSAIAMMLAKISRFAHGDRSDPDYAHHATGYLSNAAALSPPVRMIHLMGGRSLCSTYRAKIPAPRIETAPTSSRVAGMYDAIELWAPMIDALARGDLEFVRSVLVDRYVDGVIGEPGDAARQKAKTKAAAIRDLAPKGEADR